jgi:glycosyltransferase involved in cell wall biosynthesis
VVDSGASYSGEFPRGLVVVNNLVQRGRRVGADLFEKARREIPLDLVGMGAEDAGGLGEVRHADLPAFAARYRFFLHPIRYTSMGLAVIEAMLAGVPVVALATTEMPTVIRDGVNGYIDADVSRLVARMRDLLTNPATARELGAQGRRTAQERFGIRRFIEDWNAAFTHVTGIGHERSVA